MRLLLCCGLVMLGFVTGPAFGQARTLQVGPDRPFRTIAAAAAQARDGDIVEIDAGDYRGDVAVWTQRALTIKGMGEGARLHADGRSAEGKAIWVFRGGDIRVENVTFRGARVRDRNGAGIRFEGGRLLVEDCVFEDNENGILVANVADIDVVVRNSRFSENGHGDGYSHNLYAGYIRSLTVTGSYFRSARVGHLLKSRAAANYIAWNRLTNEAEGTASYEVDLPSGGEAVLYGNLIQQGPRTENPALVSFGVEGYRYARNTLDAAYNTLVNDRPQGGTFFLVAPGAQRVRAFNNLLVGPGIAGIPETNANVRVPASVFGAPERFDYRVRPGVPAGGNAIVPPVADAPPVPTMQYQHPSSVVPLASGFPPTPGAFQTPAD